MEIFTAKFAAVQELAGVNTAAKSFEEEKMTEDEYDPGIDPYAEDLEEDKPGWFDMAIIWIFMIIAVAIGLFTESWRIK